MDNEIKNPLVFPQLHIGPDVPDGCMGMTLRDYFSAFALNGILSHPLPIIKHEGKTRSETASEIAYACADAMLQERIKND